MPICEHRIPLRFACKDCLRDGKPYTRNSNELFDINRKTNELTERVIYLETMLQNVIRLERMVEDALEIISRKAHDLKDEDKARGHIINLQNQKIAKLEALIREHINANTWR